MNKLIMTIGIYSNHAVKVGERWFTLNRNGELCVVKASREIPVSRKYPCHLTHGNYSVTITPEDINKAELIYNG